MSRETTYPTPEYHSNQLLVLFFDVLFVGRSISSRPSKNFPGTRGWSCEASAILGSGSGVEGPIKSDSLPPSTQSAAAIFMTSVLSNISFCATLTFSEPCFPGDPKCERYASASSFAVRSLACIPHFTFVPPDVLLTAAKHSFFFFSLSRWERRDPCLARAKRRRECLRHS